MCNHAVSSLSTRRLQDNDDTIRSSYVITKEYPCTMINVTMIHLTRYSDFNRINKSIEKENIAYDIHYKLIN